MHSSIMTGNIMLIKYAEKSNRLSEIEGGSTMLFAAAEEANKVNFAGFDIFMILFTIVIIFALVRSITHKNKFAIAFSTVALATFLFADAIMVLGWMGVEF